MKSLLSALALLALAQAAVAQEAALEAQETLDFQGGPRVDAAQSEIAEPSKVMPELLAAIAAEREALDRRAQALDQREAELAFAAAALGEQSNQLSELKTAIEELLQRAEGNHNQDIQRLVKIYRAMKPVEAAAILSTADIEVTVLVLAAMAERDAGPILAKMDQTRAQAVSKIILERSRLPGDQKLINVKIN